MGECNAKGSFRFWVTGSMGCVMMLDLNDIVTLSTTLQPGTVRCLPGGRTETELPMFEVVVRLRSGQQERLKMNQATYEAMITAMGYEVPK